MKWICRLFTVKKHTSANAQVKQINDKLLSHNQVIEHATKPVKLF